MNNIAILLQSKNFIIPSYLSKYPIINEEESHKYKFILIEKGNKFFLKDNSINCQPICVDFESPEFLYELKTTGRKRELIKSLGSNLGNQIKIVDATAGLGKDSFLFAYFGISVVSIEQNPLVFTLLESGLKNISDEKIKNIANNIAPINCNSIDFLKNIKENDFPDIIYLDPMFPRSKKSRLVKKEMQILKNLETQTNEEELFLIALNKIKKRLIVKRPVGSDYLTNLKPSYIISGKVCRFDIYLSNLK